MKKFKFEVHRFAPELNRIYINGAMLPFENWQKELTSNHNYNIRLYRKHNQPNKNRKGYILKKEYQNKEYKSLNKTFTGLSDPTKMLEAVKHLKNTAIGDQPIIITIKSYFI